MRSERGRSKRTYWSAACVVVLMCLAGAERWRTAEPVGIPAFEKQVREAWELAPVMTGDWVGRDQALPVAAVQLLRPNALLNRRYLNLKTGEEAWVLAIHCSDVRDMEGHYPPNCYPGNGWQFKSASTRDFAEGRVRGTEYEFDQGRLIAGGGLWVAGTFVVRGSGTVPDMQSMRLESRKGPSRHFGVAQVQVVISTTIPLARRHEIADELYRAYGGLIDAATGEGQARAGTGTVGRP